MTLARYPIHKPEMPQLTTTSRAFTITETIAATVLLAVAAAQLVRAHNEARHLRSQHAELLEAIKSIRSQSVTADIDSSPSSPLELESEPDSSLDRSSSLHSIDLTPFQSDLPIAIETFSMIGAEPSNENNAFLIITLTQPLAQQ